MKFNVKAGIVLALSLLLVAGALIYSPQFITVSNSVNGRELPIYCVDTDQKVVGLSFDAAWGNEDTPQILAILEKHGVHVTFFMTGGWVDDFPEDVKEILAAGHDLGNHSENHKNMSQLSKDEKIRELMDVHEKVKKLTGYEMKLFRPPYGDYDDEVILTAKECGYETIQWSVDSLDWKDYGIDSIIQTVCEHKKLDNGAIILMHNGATYTAQALEQVIISLKEQGYEIVPISELVLPEPYHMDHTGKQFAD
ncbi:MAG: polysaccharide deacetylase family protein [Clostridia bacterium]|nr:polysaccharide deacetylase family protein [Clostridia bacterium]